MQLTVSSVIVLTAILVIFKHAAESQSLYDSIYAQLQYEEKPNNNFLVESYDAHFDFLLESLEKPPEDMEKNGLWAIMNNHRKMISDMIEDIQRSVEQNAKTGKVKEDIDARAFMLVQRVASAEAETPTDPNKIKARKEQLDAAIYKQLYHLLFFCARWSVLTVYSVLGGATEVFASNLLLPETDWNPRPSNFFEDWYTDYLSWVRLRSHMISATNHLSSFHPNSIEALFIWQFNDPDFKRVLREARIRFEPVINEFSQMMTTVTTELQKFYDNVQVEWTGWDERGNRTEVPLRKQFQNWNIPEIINLTQTEVSAIDKFLNVDNRTIRIMIESLFYPMPAVIYDEVAKYVRGKEFADCAAATVHPEFRQLLKQSNTGGDFPTKMLKLEHKMMVGVGLFKLSKAKELFAQRVFPLAHRYLGRFSLPVLRDNRISSSVVHEFAKNIVKGFKANANSTNGWTEISGNGTEYVWKYQDIGPSIFSLLQTRWFGDDDNRYFVILEVPKGQEKMAAIKIRKLNFTLKAQDPNVDKELQKDLVEFGFHVKHPGYSIFKTDGKNYLLTQKEWSNYFRDEEDIQRLADGNVMLGPYTTWVFWLDNGVGTLRKYAGKPIDLILKIQGHFIPQGINWSELQMAKYYKETLD